ncbi:MAG: hypothetical protein GWP08_01730 [Nitrospiraceae bacterium]|nr:hypothetical protein [Nitrospiraceae bacterium]
MRRGRDGYAIKLAGKPAIAILIVIAAILTWRLVVTHDTVPDEVQDRLREVLGAEYAGVVLPDIEAGVAQRDSAKVNEGAKRLKSVMENITFPSLKSRGGGDHYYVRAEILVNDRPPPKGKSVRYFQFSHSMLLGYVYSQEALAVEYYLPFMD